MQRGSTSAPRVSAEKTWFSPLIVRFIGSIVACFGGWPPVETQLAASLCPKAVLVRAETRQASSLQAIRLDGGAQLELAGSGSSGETHMHDYGGIGERFFIHLNAHLRVALGVGENLRVVRCGVGPGEAESEASTFDRRASVGDSDVHGQRSARMHGPGIDPLEVKLLLRRQRFRCIPLVEDGIEFAVADGVEPLAMQLAQHLLSVLFAVQRADVLSADFAFRRRGAIGNRALPDAAAPNEDLRLHQLFAFARFALHVVDRVFLPTVRIKATYHTIRALPGCVDSPVKTGSTG